MVVRDRSSLWVVSLILLTLILTSVTPVAAGSQVGIVRMEAISDHDLGLKALSPSPDMAEVLLVGSDGFAMTIDADEPQRRYRLQNDLDDTLLDIAWHPGGRSALITGENGTVLRYSQENSSLTHVNGSAGALVGADASAVAWRGAGDWAYVGADDGRIWRYRESEGFILLEGHDESQVTDISCHQSEPVCVVMSYRDGVGIISADHEVEYIGGAHIHWMRALCPTTGRNCLITGTGLDLGYLELDLVQPHNSRILNTQSLTDIDASLTSLSLHSDDAVTLGLVPFGILEYRVDEWKATVYVDQEEVVRNNPLLAGATIIGTWSLTSTDGYIITDWGDFLRFEPMVTSEVGGGLVGILIFGAVVIAVPGVVVGLIFMNSNTLQEAYYKWSKGRKEKKREKRAAQSTKDD